MCQSAPVFRALVVPACCERGWASRFFSSVLVPLRASPVPSVVRGSLFVKVPVLVPVLRVRLVKFFSNDAFCEEDGICEGDGF